MISRFSRPVSSSWMAADCPDNPIERRTALASCTTSCPSTTARPPSGSSNVVRMRTAVVLPAPFGPSTPSTVPRGTDKSIPRSAWTSPNDFVRSSTRIAGWPSAMNPPEHPRVTNPLCPTDRGTRKLNLSAERNVVRAAEQPPRRSLIHRRLLCVQDGSH